MGLYFVCFKGFIVICNVSLWNIQWKMNTFVVRSSKSKHQICQVIHQNLCNVKQWILNSNSFKIYLDFKFKSIAKIVECLKINSPKCIQFWMWEKSHNHCLIFENSFARIYQFSCPYLYFAHQNWQFKIDITKNLRCHVAIELSMGVKDNNVS